MERLVSSVLDPARVLEAVAGPDRGGSVAFVGTVRDRHNGRAVIGLEYSAYESMAEREMAAILAEAEERFATSVEAVHRTGRLEVGEISIVVAAAHAHRGAAFDACRWVLDEIKSRVPIWKYESYADGSSEWVGQVGVASPSGLSCSVAGVADATGAEGTEGAADAVRAAR